MSEDLWEHDLSYTAKSSSGELSDNLARPLSIYPRAAVLGMWSVNPCGYLRPLQKSDSQNDFANSTTKLSASFTVWTSAPRTQERQWHHYLGLGGDTEQHQTVPVVFLLFTTTLSRFKKKKKKFHLACP